MDLSALSDADLLALKAGDLSKVSDAGLASLKAQASPPAQPAATALTPNPGPQPSAAKGGAAGGYFMGLRDPIDAGAQILRRLVPDSVGNAIDTFGNWLASKGLPVAPSTGVAGVDNVVKAANQDYDASRKLAAGGNLTSLVTGQKPSPGFDWARLAGNVINPATLVAGPEMTGINSLKGLALAGAKGGAISGAMQPVTTGDPDDFWQQKVGQTALGAAGGALVTPAAAKAVEGAAKGIGALASRFQTAATPADQRATIALNNVFSSQGIAPADVPEAILQSVTRQVNEALAAKTRIDPATMIRKAQFEAVGLTGDAAPTLGQATRDPMQFANEKNLSGVQINMPNGGQGNPLADRFALQNQRLGGVFDSAGAAGATDRTTAGQTILDALRASDVPVKASVDDAYAAARAMNNGRAADLERGTFSQAANNALDQGMLGHALPADVRGLLNDISSGKTPFNVDAAVQIDTILSRSQRAAQRAGNDNAAYAVGVVRDALHSTPLAGAADATASGAARAPGAGIPAGPALAGSVDRSVPALRDSKPVSFQIPQAPGAAPAGAAATDTGPAARAAFDQARAAARDRFATIENTPALKAALNDAAPDKFVQQYIVGADTRDVQALRNVLQNSPEALGQARAQIADTLKRAAFGSNLSGDGGFSASRYANVLQSIGRQKLEVFFTPQEIVQMSLAGKVASDINSVPAGAAYAVNRSGTGAAVMNLLSKLSESPLMRKVPGARMIANQIGEIRTENAMDRALRAQPSPQPAPDLSPEAVRAIQRLFPLAATGGGALGGQAAQ